MLRKIYSELVLIRKELQAIRIGKESSVGEEFRRERIDGKVTRIPR